MSKKLIICVPYPMDVLNGLISDHRINNCHRLLDVVKCDNYGPDDKLAILQYCSYWWLDEGHRLNPYILQILTQLTRCYNGLKFIPQRQPTDEDFPKLLDAFNNNQTTEWLTLVNSTDFQIPENIVIPTVLRSHLEFKKLHLVNV